MLTTFCFVFGLGLMVVIHNASMLRYEYVNCVCSYVGVDVVVEVVGVVVVMVVVFVVAVKLRSRVPLSVRTTLPHTDCTRHMSTPKAVVFLPTPCDGWLFAAATGPVLVLVLVLVLVRQCRLKFPWPQGVLPAGHEEIHCPLCRYCWFLQNAQPLAPPA